jgi:hypothetical protein
MVETKPRTTDQDLDEYLDSLTPREISNLRWKYKDFIDTITGDKKKETEGERLLRIHGKWGAR